jgi:hypothetical protein
MDRSPVSIPAQTLSALRACLIGTVISHSEPMLAIDAI